MDRKEKVLSYLQSKNYIPLRIDEIAVMLDVPKNDFSELESILSELEGEGKIIRGKKGRYFPANAKGQRYSGVLRCHPSGKFGFIVRDDGEDIYVSSADMGSALNGDTVLAQHKSGRGSRTEASIIRVLKRAENKIVGVIYTKKGKHFIFRADDPRFWGDIYIRLACAEGVDVGMRVAVGELNVSPDRRVYGRVLKILGRADEISSYIEGILINNKIKTEFDKKTLEEADKISENINISKDRIDLREKKIFTIDGALARDFDDAVSIDVLDGGNYYLGVHIADVSEYVTPGSALDSEAYMRGNSVYLPDRVIPMLPERLSNGVCSLNPNVDRLTLSVFMEIDKSGKIVENRISKSVIRSSRRLTYEDMNRLFENDDELKAQYPDIYDDLQNMRTLAKILRKRRFERGAVDFDFPETEIITGSDGLPTEIRPLERGESNRLIEEFMLAANETVAEYAYWAEIPFVYRVHQPPSVEKVLSFQAFLRPFGLAVKGKFDEDNPVKPKAFEQILDKVRNTPYERIVSKTMLRSLMKAEYRAENLGHFGLAAKYYCHFTSPIRRYPDLVVHRALKDMLDGCGAVDEAIAAKAAKHSSDTETAADLCERDCDDLLKAVYMSQFIGCDFDGVVSGVTNFGMFVELENGAEGMIRLENMTDDYFVCDEAAQALVGERSNKRYAVGDSVSVMVVRCDLALRSIDFILSENASRTLLSKFTDNRKKRRKK